MSDRIDDAKAIAIDVFGEDDVIRRVDAVEALAEWGISPLVLMPVPPARQWIPCSERLPEHRLYVLVAYKYEYGLIDNGITWYSETENKWNTFREVIAWMPLPEPFKGGDTNDVS